MAYGRKESDSEVVIRVTNPDGTVQTLRVTVEEAKIILDADDIYAEFGYLEGIGYPLNEAEDIKAGMFIPCKK